MKSLVQFIKESLINEGGKAVTANPIPAYITPLLYKEIEDAILKEFHNHQTQTKIHLF